ncbi:hypothetical protein [Streptomyces lateritius]|uniref:hypothetical protein n=1 Tax=Streptomyces lateritius TaxID=67313 RepID=UPI001C8CB1CC|nr:hypothetical protein [Streptomyces lateritius]MBX9427031.1 hypothetical protein [Streptomyces lateritius]
MKQNRWGLYAIAVAIAVVGALALGVPVGILAILGVALACPLMVLSMTRGTHDQNGHDEVPHRHHDDHSGSSHT